MYETYPKGGKTTHKKEKHEESKDGWSGDSSKTSYPKSASSANDIDTNESKQSKRAPFADGGGNKQVSANYPQSGGKNGKSFNTDCNY